MVFPVLGSFTDPRSFVSAFSVTKSATSSPALATAISFCTASLGAISPFDASYVATPLA